MSDQYLGELRLVYFNFAPKCWAMANGSILSIQRNAALFSLLGTFYGGNGVQTFALPDLRGRLAIGFGNSPQMGSISIGQTGGEVNHTLLTSEMPQHNHLVNASGASTSDIPAGNYFGGGGAAVYNAANGLGGMNAAMVGSSGGSQPHSNTQPYLVMTWIISLTGIFPSRN